MAGSNEELRARLPELPEPDYVWPQDSGHDIPMWSENKMRAYAIAALAPAQEPAGGGEDACKRCDGTGDVHRADGEWLGKCDCPTPTPQAAARFVGDERKHVICVCPDCLTAAGAAPEGFVLVPREPTDAMIEAAMALRPIGQFVPGFSAEESVEACARWYAKENRVAAYHAMLAASPQPGAQEVV